MNVVSRHINEITDLCSQYEVEELFLFGSILSNDYNSDSDIDMLVSFYTTDPLAYADNYFNLKFDLESLLQRKIDLVEEKAISNSHFMQQLNMHKIQIYGREGKSVA